MSENTSSPGITENSEAADHLVELKNGAIYDTEKGHIVKGAPLTSAKAREMNKARWDKVRDSYAKGARDAVGVSTDEQLVERIGGATATVAVNPKDRRQIQAAQEVLDRLFGAPAHTVDAPGMTMSISADAIPLIAKALQDARELRQSD